MTSRAGAPAAPASVEERREALTGLHFAARGLTGGFEDAEDYRLRTPLPAHLAQGYVALLYEKLPTRSPLRSALRRMTRLGDPRLLRPEGMTIGRDAKTGTPFCVPPYNPDWSGFRFQWQKPPGKEKTAGAPRHPEGDLPPAQAPGQGVEEAGRYLPYAYLHRYCADGTLEDYPVYDNASHAPVVFVSMAEFTPSDRNVAQGLQALMLAHAEHKLTVTACRVAPFRVFLQFAQHRLQHHVRRYMVPQVRSLPPLFTSQCRGGVRGRHELSLRTHVLLPLTLRGSNTSTVRRRALTAVGPHVCARLWNTHARADTGCLVTVLGPGLGKTGFGPSHHPWPAPASSEGKIQTVLRRGKGRAAQGPMLPPPPTSWRELTYKQRSTAVSTLADPLRLDWRPRLPALPAAFKWPNAHHRGHVRACCWRSLNVPQVYTCQDADTWHREVRATDRRHVSSSKLLVTNTVSDDWRDFDGVLYCGDGGVDVGADGRKRVVHWRDEVVTHAEEEHGRRRKQRDVYVWVDFLTVETIGVEAEPSAAAAHWRGDNTRRPVAVICVPRREMAWLSLYVQWFPLLCGDQAPVHERPLHPRLVACLHELQAQCSHWIAICEEQLVVDAQERAGRRRMLTQRKEYFEGLLAQYTALHGFTYEGCNTGVEHHAGQWLEPADT